MLAHVSPRRDGWFLADAATSSAILGRPAVAASLPTCAEMTFGCK